MYSSASQPLAMTDLHADKRDDLPRREVTMDDVTVRYARSGGPGGQNVNKLVSRRITAAAVPVGIHYYIIRPCARKSSLALCGHTEY